MTREEVLIGWLCVLRYQFQCDRSLEMPKDVALTLRGRGWLHSDSDVDWDGMHQSHITDAGNVVCDLSGPEWGLDTIPEEAEA